MAREVRAGIVSEDALVLFRGSIRCCGGICACRSCARLRCTDFRRGHRLLQRGALCLFCFFQFLHLRFLRFPLLCCRRHACSAQRRAHVSRRCGSFAAPMLDRCALPLSAAAAARCSARFHREHSRGTFQCRTHTFAILPSFSHFFTVFLPYFACNYSR